ncbi:hypothetical protein AU05_10595 [Ectopseudomonas composti]|uniref:Uncharacterized protein n=1 Tax=Ectopseudomonas composti TaxID=658457 RepID=A0ABP3C202_9GAMM|nr:hypothetical protein AU05_10595 [Pseudomonas composti]
MGSQCLPVPAETKGNGIQRIATLHHIVAAAHGLTLYHWSTPLVLSTVDHLHATWGRADAADQRAGSKHGQRQANGCYCAD